ncbi:hypothetical protein ONZ51_g1154 [Trametes cubensis]|uniref:FHA domain-containing protein n=1 Tax=Trametes cubensis TaxID=1111947 RepID=A0AAD7U4D6_9APHY|nr:hypothetical protein ONZ51_g1154 [Trametes cubensis]
MDSTPGKLNIAGVLSLCDAQCGREVLISVEGIVLHVDEYGDQPAETLTFTKSTSRTISVGRKSSQGNVPDDPGRALFRCPVVSRKHAKITFTEYGNVYIIDLRSHHGTHILRPGELVSTPCLPEVPTVLADGDQITFGKSVGRDAFLVRPIVVRVQLMFGRDASLRAPSPLPNSVTNDDPASPDKPLTRTNSGRYGVYPPSPESSPSTSDGESDIREISPPTLPYNPPPTSQRLLFRAGSQSRRIRLLQSILPPVHLVPERLSEELDDQSLCGGAQVVPSAGFEEEDMELSSSRSASPDNAEVTFSLPGGEEPPIVGAWPGSSSASASCEESTPSAPELSPAPIDAPVVVYPEVIEISDDEGSTPFPPPAQVVAPDEMIVEEVEIEAVESIDPVEDPEYFDPRDEAFARQLQTIIATNFRVEDHIDHGAQAIDTHIPMAEAQATEILNELHAMRATHEEEEVIFASHVQQTKDRLGILDNQMQATNNRLSERDDQLSSIQSRLNGLGTLVSDLQERSMLAERESARMEELVKDISAAKDILQETCELQQEARARMAEELDAVKNLRAEAAAAVAEVKLAAAAASSSANALKRKRSEEDAESVVSTAASSDGRLIAPLPSKRRRTMNVVSAVAQTATIASMGAVAAWAALAFS